MSKKKVWRAKNVTAVLEIQGMEQILKNKGLDPHGDVQMHHTQNVLKYITAYMPKDSGQTIKLTESQTVISRPLIVTDAPYARFLYRGKLMVSDVTGSAWARKGETKHVVNTPLAYTHTKNPQAGPYWDRALVAAKGAKLVSDLQEYIRRKEK